MIIVKSRDVFNYLLGDSLIEAKSKDTHYRPSILQPSETKKMRMAKRGMRHERREPIARRPRRQEWRKRRWMGRWVNYNLQDTYGQITYTKFIMRACQSLKCQLLAMYSCQLPHVARCATIHKQSNIDYLCMRVTRLPVHVHNRSFGNICNGPRLICIYC